MQKSNRQLSYLLNLFVITFCAASLIFHTAEASETSGTITSLSPYAWGENLGWINFHPTHGGLSITDTSVTGYAWSQNSGWINFAPQGAGVRNDTSGTLSGYAWSANTGWINFSGVHISSQGIFTGIAGTASSTPGRINFDCTNCAVRTDWRPVTARTIAPQASRTVGGFAAAAAAPLPAEPLNAVTNAPLLFVPPLPGTLLQESPIGPVVVLVPHNAAVVPFTLHVNILQSAEKQNDPPIPDAFLLGGAFYEIKALDSKGNELHAFDSPIHITLPLPANLQNVRRLAVYWYDEANSTWNRVPNVNFTARSASFSVMHLTRFAIFALRTTQAIKAPVLITTGGGALITEQQNVTPQMETQGIQTTPITSTAQLTHGARGAKSIDTATSADLLRIVLITFTTMLAYILARKRAYETK